MAFFSPAAVLAWQANGDVAVISGSPYLWIALATGVVGLIAAFFYARVVLSGDTGLPEMRKISDAIRQGAEAFMKRQYSTIAMIAVALAIVLYIGYRLSPFTAPYANKVVISFLIGAVVLGALGAERMLVSIRTNIRTATAARTSMGKALQMALRGGAVTGLVVVALSLLGVGFFSGGSAA